jgi:DNA-nicking Smr family endonuclease
MSGVDKRRATTAPQATLDLHGMTQEKAHAQVIAFIKRAVGNDYRVVRIITGKGSRTGGVLKASLPKWLEVPQLRPFILAISYATPREGGEGVLHVQLKRKR